MEFPSSVDCVIYGTGFAESVLSASLAVLGKQVLHLDRNVYYGGHLSSMRFPDLYNLLVSPENSATSDSNNITGSPMSIDLSSGVPIRVMQASCHWFLSQDPQQRRQSVTRSTASMPSDQQSIFFECEDTNYDEASLVPTTDDVMTTQNVVTSDSGSVVVPIQVGTDGIACDLVNSEEAVPVPTVQATARATEVPNSPETDMKWSRDEVERRVRRLDIDLMPKIIYSESQTTKVILRSDVHRYLDFLFVSRLLAHTIATEQSNAAAVTLGVERGLQSAVVDRVPNGPSVVQIPVGRSEMFKTRILSLRQKRSLGVFFEWCTHLATEEATARPHGQQQQPAEVGNLTNSEVDADYFAFVDRPFHEFLVHQGKLDQFTRQLVLTNLAFGTEFMSTRQAIQQLRRLLFSMGRFGAHPLLWPMYGCGDLPQAFSRMSAVFGTTFCLDTSVISIQRAECEQGDGRSTRSHPSEDNQASVADSRNFVVSLSDGHTVHTGCVLIGADQVDADWVLPQVKRWCARAVLITDRSVYPEGRKPADVSLLALPLSGRGDTMDPVFLLELPIDPSTRNSPDQQLLLVHLTATVSSPACPEALLRPVVDRFFKPWDTTIAENEDADIRPRLFWAGYFCIPDLSKVSSCLPGTRNSLLDDTSGVFLCPGLDTSFHLDNVVDAAESLFYRLTDHLNISRSQEQTLTSTLTAVDGSSDHSDDQAPPSTYVSLEARWDGLFPPRPPRQDEIVQHDLVVVPGQAQETAEDVEPTTEGEISTQEEPSPQLAAVGEE